MLINTANLRAFQFMLDTSLKEGMKETIPPEKSLAAVAFYQKEAMFRKSVKYPWVSAQPQIVKIPKGTSQEEQLVPMNQIEVVAGRAGVLIGIDEFELECDQEGIYVDLARADGADIADFDERYAASLLTGGFAAVSGDGQTKFFFDAARKVSPDLGANSSVFTNVYGNVLGATGYDIARKALYEMVDGKGRQRGLGNRGFVLVCGPENEAAALDLLKTQNQAGGATNKYYNTADLVISPYLGTSVKWFLVAKSSAMSGRPLIKQTNAPWRSRMTGTDSPTSIKDGKILFQSWWMGEHAYGDPQRIIGFRGDGS